MSTEVVGTAPEHNHRRNILDHIDAIADDAPLCRLRLENDVRMEVLVGRRAPRSDDEYPQQVIIARVSEQGEYHRRVTIAYRTLTDQRPRLIGLNDQAAHELHAGQQLADAEVDPLSQLLDETDFAYEGGAGVMELQARMLEGSRYGSWLESLLDPQPLVDLV